MVQISVVIPLYNKVNYIAQTISLIMNQTVQDFEIVVVNDGSTDGSEHVVAAMTDPRIKLIHQKNAGAGAARNTGIREASSDFIAFLDADDEWEPDHLAELLSLKEEYPEAGLYLTGLKVFHYNRIENAVFQNYKGQIDLFEPIGFFKLFAKSPHCSASAVKRIIFNKVGYFNTCKNSQDVDLFFRIALNYDVIYTPKGVSIFRIDRSELMMPKLMSPGKDQYTNRAIFLSRERAENCSCFSEYFIICAKNYIGIKKSLIDFLWARQLYFIALFALWGHHKEAYSHFWRTYNFYHQMPRSVRLFIALIFFMCLALIPSPIIRAFYNIKHFLCPNKYVDRGVPILSCKGQLRNMD
jgi:glycosyltransferase involved in cell wall biosynthesis